MCIEDIRLGRQRESRYYRYIPVAAGNVILGANPYRVAIIWFPPESSLYRVGPDPGVSADESVKVQASTPPVVMTVETYGRIVTQTWYEGPGNPINHFSLLEVSLYEV